MIVWKMITKQKHEEHIINYFKTINVNFEVINEVILVKRPTKDREFIVNLRINLENRDHPCKFHRILIRN